MIILLKADHAENSTSSLRVKNSYNPKPNYFPLMNIQNEIIVGSNINHTITIYFTYLFLLANHNPNKAQVTKTYLPYCIISTPLVN